MAYRVPERDDESARTYDDRSAMVTAILVAVLMDAAIIGLFMFITWAAYNTD